MGSIESRPYRRSNRVFGDYRREHVSASMGKGWGEKMALALIEHPPSSGTTQHRINTILKGSPGFVRGKHVEVEFEHVCRTVYFLPSVWLPVVDLICLMLRREGKGRGEVAGNLIRVSPCRDGGSTVFFLTPIFLTFPKEEPQHDLAF